MPETLNVVVGVSGECRARTTSIRYATPSDLSQLESYVAGEIRSIGSDLRQLDNQLSRLDQRFESFRRSIDTRVQALEGRVQSLEGRVQSLRNDVNRISNTLSRLAETTDGIAGVTAATAETAGALDTSLTESRQTLEQQSAQLQRDLEQMIEIQQQLTGTVEASLAALAEESERIRQAVDEIAADGRQALARLGAEVTKSGEKVTARVESVEQAWQALSDEAQRDAERRQHVAEQILATDHDGHDQLSASGHHLERMLELAAGLESYQERQQALARRSSCERAARRLAVAVASSRDLSRVDQTEDSSLHMLSALAHLPASRNAAGEAFRLALEDPCEQIAETWPGEPESQQVHRLLQLARVTTPPPASDREGPDAPPFAGHETAITALVESAIAVESGRWAEAVERLREGHPENLPQPLAATLISCFGLSPASTEER